jgi:hypothetical protein
VALYFSAHWCGPCKRCASSPPRRPHPAARAPIRPPVRAGVRARGAARPRRPRALTPCPPPLPRRQSRPRSRATTRRARRAARPRRWRWCSSPRTTTTTASKSTFQRCRGRPCPLPLRAARPSTTSSRWCVCAANEPTARAHARHPRFARPPRPHFTRLAARAPQEGIPRVVVLDAATGAVVNDNARAKIVESKSCKAATFA